MLTLRPRHRPLVGRRPQRGLSLVEMMIGVAIGLFIVAGATVLAASQLGENRKLIMETQLQQDVRAASDIITRELRRSGFDRHPEFLVWSSSTPLKMPKLNNWLGLQVNVGGEVVSYNYDSYTAGTTSFGYSLDNNTIRQRRGLDVQDLTDRNTMKVTAFTVTKQDVPGEQLACPKLCSPGNDQDCWPTMSLTEATITITAEAANDPLITRTIVSRVRLRNDGPQFNISPTEACPS